MKIPQYVDILLKQRTRYANRLDAVMSELDKWLDKNNVECEDCDTHTGVEIYCNPGDSEQRVRQSILNHKKE